LTGLIHIEVPVVPHKELSTEYSGEKSASIRERVIKARDAQLERFKSDKGLFKRPDENKAYQKHCKLKPDAQSLLDNAMQKPRPSARHI
jgi:magnesium chelatase family protein